MGSPNRRLAAASLVALTLALGGCGATTSGADRNPNGGHGHSSQNQAKLSQPAPDSAPLNTKDPRKPKKVAKEGAITDQGQVERDTRAINAQFQRCVLDATNADKKALRYAQTIIDQLAALDDPRYEIVQLLVDANGQIAGELEGLKKGYSAKKDKDGNLTITEHDITIVQVSAEEQDARFKPGISKTITPEDIIIARGGEPESVKGVTLNIGPSYSEYQELLAYLYAAKTARRKAGEENPRDVYLAFRKDLRKVQNNRSADLMALSEEDARALITTCGRALKAAIDNLAVTEQNLGNGVKELGRDMQAEATDLRNNELELETKLAEDKARRLEQDLKDNGLGSPNGE